MLRCYMVMGHGFRDTIQISAFTFSFLLPTVPQNVHRFFPFPLDVENFPLQYSYPLWGLTIDYKSTLHKLVMLRIGNA